MRPSIASYPTFKSVSDYFLFRHANLIYLNLYLEPARKEAKGASARKHFQDGFPLFARAATEDPTGALLAENSSTLETPSKSATFLWVVPWPARDATLHFTIDIKPISSASCATMRASGILMTQTLRSVLKGQDVVDTNFILYSRRLQAPSLSTSHQSCATAPCSVFANSDLLASVSAYFQAR